MDKVTFKARSALRSRAEASGQAHADRHGVDVVLYEVHGGYEARPATDPPPLATHRALATIGPKPGQGDAATGKPKGGRKGAK